VCRLGLLILHPVRSLNFNAFKGFFYRRPATLTEGFDVFRIKYELVVDTTSLNDFSNKYILKPALNRIILYQLIV
jgi:hypothetical protein